MSDISKKTARVLVGVGYAVDALEVIQDVADTLAGHENVLGKTRTLDDVLAGVRGISDLISTVLSGLDGSIHLPDVATALAAFREKIRSNDAAADAALAAKFPPQSPK